MKGRKDKKKIALKFLIILAIPLAFACKDELEDCYEMICDGPNNTNCREDPVIDSGCFPNGNTEFKN